MMNERKKNALLHYLEFNLVKFVERYECHIDDPDVIGDMYDQAYDLLNDMEQTIDTQREIEKIQTLGKDSYNPKQ